MNTVTVTVYDTKAKAYLPPQQYRTTLEAMRSFETTCKNPETQFNKYPEDFTLYEIGSFDDQTGELSLLDSKNHLANASEYVQ